MILTEDSRALDGFPNIPIGAFEADHIEEQWINKLEATEMRRTGQGLSTGPHRPWALDELYAAVTERLFFYNLYREPGDEDVSVIFETINASGRGLLALDLVKNSVFMRLGEGPGRDRVFEEYWAPAEDGLSKTRWSRKRAAYQEVFLYDYLIAAGEHAHQGAISQARGYSHFLRRLDRVVPQGKRYSTRLTDFLKRDLFPAAAVWPVAVGASSDVTFEGRRRTIPDEAAERIGSIMAVSAGPPVPLMLVVLVRWLRRDHGWTDRTLTNALTQIDSYVTRAAVCLTGITNLRSQFMAICGRLDGLDGTIGLSDIRAALVAKAGDSEVRLALLTNALYQEMPAEALLAVLRGIEAQLTKAGGPHKIPSKIYSVEHVYPQDDSRWQPDLARWRVSASDRVKLRDGLHLLGNLTAITHPHNSSLRNKAYTVKKEGIRKHAAGLKIHLRAATSTRWTRAEIDARGRALAAAFLAHWP